MPRELLIGAMEAHLDAHEIVPNQKQSLSKSIRLERLLNEVLTCQFPQARPNSPFPLTSTTATPQQF